MKLSCVRYMLLLVPRSVVCPFHVCSHSDSIWLFVLWGPGFLCKVWGYLYSLFLSCCFRSGICQSSSTGALLLISRQDQCSCGIVWVFLMWCRHMYLLHCVYAWCTMYVSCWDRFWCFFSFLLYVDRKKRVIMFILSQQPQYLIFEWFQCHLW